LDTDSIFSCVFFLSSFGSLIYSEGLVVANEPF